MNRDRIKGYWKQIRGRVRLGWARLTNDLPRAVESRREIFAGRLQAAYGIGKDGATRQIKAWRNTMSEAASGHGSGLHQMEARREFASVSVGSNNRGIET